MDKTSFVICYRTSERDAAITKASFYRQKGFNVRIIDTTDALIAMEASQPPFLVHALDDSDWIVVLASKSEFDDFVDHE
jgi:hypothetical protein